MDRTLLKEIKNMSLMLIPCTLLMVAAFYIAGYGGTGAVLGALIGYAAALLNYFLLALTIDISVKRKTSVQAFMGLSYTLRLVIIAAAVIFAIKSDYINYIAAVIPLVFPRIIILITKAHRSKKHGDEA